MPKQSGYLMLLIAVLLVVITGLATAFIAMMSSGTNAVSSVISANSAYDLAASAIENGLYTLSLGNCSSTWTSTTVGSQGEAQYNCVPKNTAANSTSALTNTAPIIPLASSTNFVDFGSVQIDSETIYYDGKSGNSLINAQRGKDGTIPAAHLSGANVVQSQYIITGRGGVPSLSAPYGTVTLYQAAQSQSNVYFAAGQDATGKGVILSYNGTAWTTMPLDISTPSSFAFKGIYTSANYGLAVGFSGNNSSVYEYNSNTWSLFVPVPVNKFNGYQLSDVSCDTTTSTNNCWLVGQISGGKAYAYNNNSGTFDTGPANYPITGISCINGYCAAVGNKYAHNFISTANIPLNPYVTLAGTFTEIDCPADQRCLAVQRGGNLFFYNGTWTAQPDPNPHPNFWGVHCPTTSTCFVVGDNTVILKCSLPTGTIPPASLVSCTQETVPGGTGVKSVGAVDCISETDCVAVNRSSDDDFIKYDGTNWSLVKLFPGSTVKYTLNAISHAKGGGLKLTVFKNQEK